MSQKATINLATHKPLFRQCVGALQSLNKPRHALARVVRAYQRQLGFLITRTTVQFVWQSVILLQHRQIRTNTNSPIKR